MPMYLWTCTCGKEHHVVAKVDDRNNTPTEVITATDGQGNPVSTELECTCTCGLSSSKWKRQECASTRMVRGPGWRGAKGYW